jgi:uncharacterized protein (TIGR02147 family)
MKNSGDFNEVLRNEFQKRKSRNSSYSLRAFSHFLGLSPAQISQVLSGKRPLTAKAAAQISDKLGFSPLEKKSLIESTFLKFQGATSTQPERLKEEEFKLISDWYHFAILSLSELKESKSDPRWIASQLKISASDARDAVTRLLDLKIIEVKNGKIRQIVRPLRTSHDVPSAAIRRYHQQNLDLAKEKLETIPLDDREFSTITMGISRSKLPQAKKLITQFKRQLSDLLEGGEKEAVYTFAVQLFPVSKLEKK